MPVFLVVLRRSGPQWDPARPLEEQSGFPAHASSVDGLVDTGVIVLDGPLNDEHRVVYAAEAKIGGRSARGARAGSVERDTSGPS